MKKSLKIVLIVIGALVGIVLLDTLQALIFNNNIIIGIETKGMVKKGILVNTHHCGNGKNITKFKLFNYIPESVCSKENKTREFIIVDKSKEINDFVCASALEPFYEDENYVYSYSCIMSDYIIVRYSDGKEETVKDALKSNKIKIEDLDKYNIKYYKSKKTSSEEGEKVTLKLQHFDLSLEQSEEDIQYENSLIIKNESINISGIKYENIDKGKLNDYQDKYKKVIDYIKKKYSNFDATKWNIVVNMFAVNDGNGMIKLNYQIKDIIDTNKSIVFTINNNVINKVSFINMDFETDEDKLMNLINDFKNSTIQEKKEFNKNEEFLNEEITYSYRYNTDELIYTYQLYFYQQYGDDPEDRVINNEYGTEYIINKK